MVEKKINSSDGDDLYHRAEEWLGEQNGSGKDLFRLIHELQTHQDELEIQNEELLRAIDQRDRMLRLLFGSFNYLRTSITVGYIALTHGGIIRAANHIAANFLGFDPSRLIDLPIYKFIAEVDHSGFKTFLDAIFDSRRKPICGLTLLERGKFPRHVQMEALVIESGEECLLAVNEITEQSLTSEKLEVVFPKTRQLEGIIPICMYCKRIRDDREIWHQLEKYFSDHSEMLFSHGICPECSEKILSAIKHG